MSKQCQCTSSNGQQFRFKKTHTIGAAAAEDDSQFLSECFVDTGEIEALLDCESPQRVVVGRTGAGKSALLTEVGMRAENVISLQPHALALSFIANSNVIGFFESAGVSLSPFYNLLWKHVLVVELLKKRYSITNEDAQSTYMNSVRKLLYKKDKFKEMAVDYLENWGNKFWLTTEQRVHELTEKIEKNLSGSVKGVVPGADFSVAGAKNLTTEQKSEVVQRGRKAVSDIQIRELENIISVLSDEVFDDKQRKYYVTIDYLDENWVDDRIKIKLIRSLIDVVRQLRRISNVKVIIALRQDLLDRIMHSSREPGFQEEKFESLFLDVRWNKRQLQELIERRIGLLFKRAYTGEGVTFVDVFPSSIDKEKTIDYLVSRTLMRPRDIILFVNECIAAAEGDCRLSAEIVKKAEEQYSYKRMQSLATEWLGVYPNLYSTIQMFQGMDAHFQVSDITKDFIDDKYLEIISSLENIQSDPITKAIESLYSPDSNFHAIRNFFIRELYITGFLGIRPASGSTIQWSYQSRYSLSPGQLKPSSEIYINPTFYRALSIRDKKKK